MRIEIKWHKGTLVLGDGKSEEYFSSVLGEIAKHVLKKKATLMISRMINFSFLFVYILKFRLIIN